MYERTQSFPKTTICVYDNPVNILNLSTSCSYVATLNGKYLMDKGSVTMYLKVTVLDEAGDTLIQKQSSVYASGNYSDRVETKSGTLTVSIPNVNLIKAKRILISITYSISGNNNYSNATFSNINTTTKVNVYEFKDDIVQTIVNNEMIKKVTIKTIL